MQVWGKSTDIHCALIMCLNRNSDCSSQTDPGQQGWRGEDGSPPHFPPRTVQPRTVGDPGPCPETVEGNRPAHGHVLYRSVEGQPGGGALC